MAIEAPKPVAVFQERVLKIDRALHRVRAAAAYAVTFANLDALSRATDPITKAEIVVFDDSAKVANRVNPSGKAGLEFLQATATRGTLLQNSETSIQVLESRRAQASQGLAAARTMEKIEDLRRNGVSISDEAYQQAKAEYDRVMEALPWRDSAAPPKTLEKPKELKKRVSRKKPVKKAKPEGKRLELIKKPVDPQRIEAFTRMMADATASQEELLHLFKSPRTGRQLSWIQAVYAIGNTVFHINERARRKISTEEELRVYEDILQFRVRERMPTSGHFIVWAQNRIRPSKQPVIPEPSTEEEQKDSDKAVKLFRANYDSLLDVLDGFKYEHFSAKDMQRKFGMTDEQIRAIIVEMPEHQRPNTSHLMPLRLTRPEAAHIATIHGLGDPISSVVIKRLHGVPAKNGARATVV